MSEFTFDNSLSSVSQRSKTDRLMAKLIRRTDPIFCQRWHFQNEHLSCLNVKRWCKSETLSCSHFWTPLRQTLFAACGVDHNQYSHEDSTNCDKLAPELFCLISVVLQTPLACPQKVIWVQGIPHDRDDGTACVDPNDPFPDCILSTADLDVLYSSFANSFIWRKKQYCWYFRPNPNPKREFGCVLNWSLVWKKQNKTPLGWLRREILQICSRREEQYIFSVWNCISDKNLLSEKAPTKSFLNHIVLSLN